MFSLVVRDGVNMGAKFAHSAKSVKFGTQVKMTLLLNITR